MILHGIQSWHEVDLDSLANTHNLIVSNGPPLNKNAMTLCSKLSRPGPLVDKFFDRSLIAREMLNILPQDMILVPPTPDYSNFTISF